MKSVLYLILALAIFATAGTSYIQAQEELLKTGGYDKSQYQLEQAKLEQERAMVSTTVVINEVYGGAGCGTAGCSAYDRDFIELKNISAGNVNISGWSVQYASATGTAWQVTPIPAGTVLRPGDTYLVGQSTGAAGTGVNTLPTPNASGTIAMSGTSAKVALVNSTVALSGACPTGNATIVDFVGYGTAVTCVEDPTGTASGSSTLLAVAAGVGAAPAPSTANSTARNGAGADTDDNNVDFAAGAPTPVAALQPTAATATITGRALTADGTAIPKVNVTLADNAGNVQTVLTNGFGYFTFEGLRTGETYTITAASKRYQFNPATRAVMLEDNLSDFDFRAEP